MDLQPRQLSWGSTEPRVNVVIVTYQSSATVEKALAPLRPLCEGGLLRCVVVDNASTDGTLEILRGEADWLELIESQENLGYGRGCNLGWPSSTTPYVLFLNPDAVLDATGLQTMLDFMDAHPQAGIAAPALLDSSGKPHRAGALVTPKSIIRGRLGLAVERPERFEPGSDPFRTDWLSGTVQIVRTELLRDLDGFDSRFFMYFEETDLGLRALQSGWELWAVPQAVGRHAVATSVRAAGQRLVNDAIPDHFFRSRFYYLVKHHGWPLAIAAELVDLLASGLRALARRIAGRDRFLRLERFRAPAFRFPDRPKPARCSGPAVSGSGARTTIRISNEADEPQLVELLFRVFHRWPQFEIPVSAVEHLRWKMRSDPASRRQQWVTEVDGRIVAMFVRIIRRVRVKGRDRLLRDGGDAAVDPRYQEEGLYGAMLDHVRGTRGHAEFDIGWAFSTNPRTRRRSREKQIREIANPIQVLEKPYRARAIIARRRKRHGGLTPVPLVALRIKLEAVLNRFRYPPYDRRAKGAWSITTLERFDGRIDGFFEEAARAFDFLVVRSRDYMNWRFCDPAAGRFTVRVAEQEGRILGYMVLKITEGNGYIADVLALPGRSDVVRSLVDDALGLFCEGHVESITCWMIARHPYNGILRRCGFIDSRRDVGFRYQLVSLDSDQVEFLSETDARIHLTQGDSDWI